MMISHSLNIFLQCLPRLMLRDTSERHNAFHQSVCSLPPILWEWTNSDANWHKWTVAQDMKHNSEVRSKVKVTGRQSYMASSALQHWTASPTKSVPLSSVCAAIFEVTRHVPSTLIAAQTSLLISTDYYKQAILTFCSSLFRQLLITLKVPGFSCVKQYKFVRFVDITTKLSRADCVIG